MVAEHVEAPWQPLETIKNQQNENEKEKDIPISIHGLCFGFLLGPID